MRTEAGRKEGGRKSRGTWRKWKEVHKGGSGGGSSQIWLMEELFSTISSLVLPSSYFLSVFISLPSPPSLLLIQPPLPLLGSPSPSFLLSEWEVELCSRRRKQLKINGSWVIEKPARACRPPHTRTSLHAGTVSLLFSCALCLYLPQFLFTSSSVEPWAGTMWNRNTEHSRGRTQTPAVCWWLQWLGATVYRISYWNVTWSHVYLVLVNMKLHIMYVPTACRCGQLLVSAFRLKDSVSYILSWSVDPTKSTMVHVDKQNGGFAVKTKCCIWFGSLVCQLELVDLSPKHIMPSSPAAGQRCHAISCHFFHIIGCDQQLFLSPQRHASSFIWHGCHEWTHREYRLHVMHHVGWASPYVSQKGTNTLRHRAKQWTCLWYCTFCVGGVHTWTR